MSKQLLNAKDVAARLGICRAKFYVLRPKLVAKGLKGTRLGEDKSEFYIPTALDTLVKRKQKKVKILKTHDNWFGVTYPQDKEIAQACIQKLIEQGVYPEKLWMD